MNHPQENKFEQSKELERYPQQPILNDIIGLPDEIVKNLQLTITIPIVSQREKSPVPVACNQGERELKRGVWHTLPVQFVFNLADAKEKHMVSIYNPYTGKHEDVPADVQIYPFTIDTRDEHYMNCVKTIESHKAKKLKP